MRNTLIVLFVCLAQVKVTESYANTSDESSLCPVHTHHCNGTNWCCPDYARCTPNEKHICTVDVPQLKCPSGFHLCNGTKFCCPNGLKCSGTNLCLNFTGEHVCQSDAQCPSNTFCCKGSKFCCPTGFICTGTVLCLTYFVYVAPLIALFNICLFAVLIVWYKRYRKKRNSTYTYMPLTSLSTHDRQPLLQGDTEVVEPYDQFPEKTAPPSEGVYRPEINNT